MDRGTFNSRLGEIASYTYFMTCLWILATILYPLLTTRDPMILFIGVLGSAYFIIGTQKAQRLWRELGVTNYIVRG